MYRKLLFLCLIALMTLCHSARAQSTSPVTMYVSLDFNTPYGGNGELLADFLPNTDLPGVYSLVSQSAGCNTPEGDIQMPSNIQEHDKQNVTLTAIFVPGGIAGSFSGTCTAVYSGSGSGGPSQVTFVASFEGYSQG